MTHKILNGYYRNLDGAQALLLKKHDGTNSAGILWLYRYLEQVRIRMEDAPTISGAIACYRSVAQDRQVLQMCAEAGVLSDRAKAALM